MAQRRACPPRSDKKPFHVVTAIVKLMIADGDDVVTHAAHDVGDITPLGDGAQSATHHEITQTDSHHMRRVCLQHGIPQTSKPTVSASFTVCIAFKDYHDALPIRRLRMPVVCIRGARRKHQSCQCHHQICNECVFHVLLLLKRLMSLG